MAASQSDGMLACTLTELEAAGHVVVRAADRPVVVFYNDGALCAVDNRCPHWNEQVLARGLLGDLGGEPKVACPMHKRCYSLETGAYLNGASYIATYPVRIEDGYVYVNTTPNNAT